MRCWGSELGRLHVKQMPYIMSFKVKKIAGSFTLYATRGHNLIKDAEKESAKERSLPTWL